MTLELPRLRAPESIVDGQGRPSIQFIQWWQKIAKALEDAAAANDLLDETQQDALDALNTTTEKANACYEVLGPGAYSFTASATVPEDCRTAIVDTTAGAVTLTLEPVADCISDIVFKKVDASANNVVVDADGAETIDGAATLTWNTQYQSYTLRPALEAWHII